MWSAHRYWRVTWVEDCQGHEHRFSMFGPAMEFVFLMERRGFEVELTKVNGKQ